MKLILISIAASGACFFGTSLGAMLAVLFKGAKDEVLAVVIAFAGGLMLAVVTFDLIPEALVSGGVVFTLMGIAIGTAFSCVIDAVVPRMKIYKNHGRYFRMAVVLITGIAAHNFPEGLAIGSGFAGGSKLGMEVALVIGLHDIPEGAAAAAPLLPGRLRSWQIVAVVALTAVPTAVGAVAGAIAGSVSGGVMALCLGFAAGTMLYIVCGELIPQSKNLVKGVLSTISVLVGITAGLVLINSL